MIAGSGSVHRRNNSASLDRLSQPKRRQEKTAIVQEAQRAERQKKKTPVKHAVPSVAQKTTLSSMERAEEQTMIAEYHKARNTGLDMAMRAYDSANPIDDDEFRRRVSNGSINADEWQPMEVQAQQRPRRRSSGASNRKSLQERAEEKADEMWQERRVELQQRKEHRRTSRTGIQSDRR